jgi:hypothetical protein
LEKRRDLPSSLTIYRISLICLQLHCACVRPTTPLWFTDSSALAKALLVSVGDENQTHLRTTFVNVKIYALTPAQIVTTMIAKHGVATGDDIQRLKEPLSQALLSLSDFERHMDKYLLASQKLTRTGQGLTDYAYF